MYAAMAASSMSRTATVGLSVTTRLQYLYFTASRHHTKFTSTVGSTHPRLHAKRGSTFSPSVFSSYRKKRPSVTDEESLPSSAVSSPSASPVPSVASAVPSFAPVALVSFATLLSPAVPFPTPTSVTPSCFSSSIKSASRSEKVLPVRTDTPSPTKGESGNTVSIPKALRSSEGGGSATTSSSVGLSSSRTISSYEGGGSTKSAPVSSPVPP
mmetsp:Transcript_15152/g.63965  ORF Transcript_15152/g.63965 Transcript_15152/m.63965 type:complete len:212 (-) Transcript_15152:182-817(-)